MASNPQQFDTYDDQLTAWVAGEPGHFGAQCCPDFSCCKPEFLQPVEVRRAFQLADESGRKKYLMAFLGAAIAQARPDKRVHITDGSEPEQSS